MALACRQPTYPVSYARWRLRGSSQAVSGWSTAIRLGWATSIVSATLSATTPVSPHHRLLLYPIHDRPNPSRDQIPIGCFRYDQIPVPAFWLFRCGHVTKSHLTLLLSRMNGHVSGLETRLWGREQSEEYRAVIKGGDDKKITEESPITCEVCSAHLQTSLPKADCSYYRYLFHTF